MKNVENKSFWNEEWKEMILDNALPKYKYLISNYGRIKSYTVDTQNGILLKLGTVEGFKVHRYINKDGKNVSKCIHRLVAQYFLDPPIEGQTLVMHIDYNRENNYYQNLKWGTNRDRYDHWLKFNPDWFKNEKSQKPSYSKLTESQVKRIKKKLLDPKRRTRLKIIARQFGVSEMQLNRIKRGENWGHVKV